MDDVRMGETNIKALRIELDDGTLLELGERETINPSAKRFLVKFTKKLSEKKKRIRITEPGEY